MSLVAAGAILFACPYTVAQNVETIANIPVEGWLSGGESVSGPRTNNAPIDLEPKDIESGHVAEGANFTFLYGRVLVEPSDIALGNVVSQQTRDVSVWNATFDDKTVSGIAESGTAGIDLTEPEPTPYDLAALQQTVYTVSVSTVGPAQIDATYTFTVDGVEYDVTISGTRVVLWPFAPNWKQPVNEMLSWRTSVLRSYSGKEQRSRLRSKPRRGMDYNFIAAHGEAQRLDNLLFGWQNRPFALPFWQYRVRAPADILTGALEIPLPDLENLGFAAGNLAAIFASPESFEVVEIEDVLSDRIVLARPVENDWIAGTPVYPAAVSRIRGNVPIQRMTNSVLSGRVVFDGMPADTDPFVPDEAAPDEFEGDEILLTRPNWVGPLGHSAVYDADYIDYGTGVTNIGITSEVPSSVRQYRWLLNGRERIREFRALLGRLAGQHKSLYIPTWHDDLTPVSGVTAASTALVVRDRQFFAMVGGNPAIIGVAIRAGNDVIVRKISSVGITGNDTSIGLTAPIGVTLTVEQIRSISLVARYRLATDDVTIQWQTNRVAVVESSFQLVLQ